MHRQTTFLTSRTTRFRVSEKQESFFRKSKEPLAEPSTGRITKTLAELRNLVKTIGEERMRSIIPKLNKKEIEILDKRVYADKPESLSQIANRFDVSRERIREIEQNLYRKLNTFLRTGKLYDIQPSLSISFGWYNRFSDEELLGLAGNFPNRFNCKCFAPGLYNVLKRRDLLNTAYQK